MPDYHKYHELKRKQHRFIERRICKRLYIVFEAYEFPLSHQVSIEEADIKAIGHGIYNKGCQHEYNGECK